MRKILLLLALFLASCNSSSSDNSCSAPDGTYPASTGQSWNDIEYQLPYCWSSQNINEELILKDLNGPSRLKISYEAPDVSQPNLVKRETLTNPEGKSLNIEIIAPNQSTENIVRSILFTSSP